ncbi:hypothetical protein BN1723_018915, partial [Verticillium longisporum]
MATAIRSTVEDYMTPPEPKFTAFPASRITQKILSKQLDEKDQKDWSAVHEITPIPSSPTPSSRSVADDDTASSATLPPGSPSPPHITHHEPGQSLLKNPETITAETLNNHMYTAGDPPLDIFVRTSGVERLSSAPGGWLAWKADFKLPSDHLNEPRQLGSPKLNKLPVIRCDMAEIFQNISKWLLRSPPSEWAINQLRELLIGALKQGPVPQHVAFEMDGNRRYARGKRMETIEGHHHGFEALARVLEICYKSGVKVVTVYAFSIENFNRPQYEVDGLMELAKVKLEQLTHHGDLLDKYGAAVRVLGQRDLLREDVLEVVDRAVEMTKNNKKNALNICLPYTSREEMATAIRSTVEDYMTPPEPKFTAFPASR